MTSKLQVTLPKALARQYHIAPGDEVLWVAAGDAIRVVPAAARPRTETPAARLRLFDRATERQRERETSKKPRVGEAKDRGWTREELYQRGRSR